MYQNLDWTLRVKKGRATLVIDTIATLRNCMFVPLCVRTTDKPVTQVDVWSFTCLNGQCHVQNLPSNYELDCLIVVAPLYPLSLSSIPLLLSPHHYKKHWCTISNVFLTYNFSTSCWADWADGPSWLNVTWLYLHTINPTVRHCLGIKLASSMRCFFMVYYIVMGPRAS